jgi:hypothetical protein
LVIALCTDLGRPFANGPGSSIILFLVVPLGALFLVVGSVMLYQSSKRRDPTIGILFATLLGGLPALVALYGVFLR